ncbi:DNA polymerase III subunit gamma/tau [Oryzomicrobium terrae]|uniref:DNA polymerase III subunit gamma/tau n=1 Tax=Oryzomicrobium terrae TaxID=1735038 RepID=A0A5C1E6C3_9RHOO|nr:DNA polymerase III subunit gamma/tau [Oryzomicrobium terrae]QEL64119.1 DNA polymerase III subunit gamma/tau [Oryzomicrobium terrae]
MSYQVLARKWRPKSFQTLVGQEHVVRALTHALTEGRLHHAYLFTGTRGVGKTTIARILAKSLNCESGVTATPCGQCAACSEIDAGRFVDLLEVDAATNTRVDEMRQLLENAVYAPTRGRFKVYVIDEVHMLSNSAFNAMLKTLEEPPEHVKFILATTDPQKIPVTVLSRCLQFNLKQMSPPNIVSHLTRILEAETVAFEPPALALLARSANGSMRDALSLLDQAIAHGAGRVEEAGVRDMLGTVDQDHLFTVLDALIAESPADLVAVADTMAGRSLSFDSALAELATLLTQIQIEQMAPGALGDTLLERERVTATATAMAPEFVQLAYQIALKGREELPLAPDAHAGFLMTLLRMHAFRPAGSSAGSAAPAAGGGSARRPSLPAAAAPRVAAPAVSATPAATGRDAAPAFSASPAQAVPEAAAVVAPPPASAAQEPAPLMASASDNGLPPWGDLLARARLSGMARELAYHCELRGSDGGTIALRLPPAHRHLLIKPAQDRLVQALGEALGRAVQVRIELADTESETPAAVAKRERQERQDDAVSAIEADPFVREVIDTFDATLIEASIKPL